MNTGKDNITKSHRVMMTAARVTIGSYYRLCEERNPNLIVQIVFYAMLIVYFYLLSLFVSVVYKSSASHSHRLLVIKAADEVWMLALIHPTEGQFRFSKTKNEVN